MTTRTSIYEEYLLADDKEAYLQSIKTTNEYKELMVHYCLNNQKPVPGEFSGLLDTRYGDRKFALKNLLQKIEASTDEQEKKTLLDDLNRNYLNLSFHHQRQNGTRQVAGTTGQTEQILVSKLSHHMENFTNVEWLINNFYHDSSVISNFEKVGRANLHKIDILKLKRSESQINLLRHLPNFLHIENIGQLLETVKENYKKEFEVHKRTWVVDAQIWDKMTLDQLNSAAEFSDMESNINMNLRRFRLENYEVLHTVNQDMTESQLREHFIALQDKIKDTKRYEDVVRFLDKCLLINSIKVEDIDIDRYERFINHPFTDNLSGCFNKDTNYAISTRLFIPMNNTWNIFPWYVSRYNDRNLLETGKRMICVCEENVKRFSKYFDEHQLHRLFIEHQTLNGGPIEAYQSLFGQYTTNQLVNRKELLITEINSDNFEDKDVSISLKIKNIESLEVRQFQVDTVNYLKQNMKYPDQNMDLDGLVPEKMNIHNYLQPKHQEHLETFTFPDIDKIERGIFIIDFVGGGLMSRAVIKKGTLSIISKPAEYGYEFYILDSKKEICTGEGTGIFVDGKFIPTNEEGVVSIPYDSSHFNRTGVLIHDGFGFLGNVEVPNERYELKSTLFFNDEGILPGKKANLLIRTRLYLNEQSISINKLKDTHVILSTTTLDGITNTKVFDDIELKDDEDFLIDFMVPNKLTNFSVNLTTKVETVGSSDINLHFFEEVRVSRGEHTDKISQGFFRQTEEGHFFDVKGKNGEPIPKVPIHVTIKRVFDNSTYNETIYTDENGTVSLGKLENVSSVNVQYEGENLGSKIFDDHQIDMPRSYTICKGEDLVLPSRGLPVTQEHFDLLQNDYKFGGLISSRFSNIKSEGKNIVLEGLDIGTYQLYYKTGIELTQIGINVLDANRWKNSDLMIETDNQLRSVSGELRFINIQSIANKEGHLNIDLSSNDLENTVVHVMGYNYSPVLADFMSDNLEKTTSARVPQNFNIAQTKNIYISGKNLGDEMNYVLDRKNKKNFIGNTLKKPSILLHRKFIRETTEDEEKLKSESNFDSSTLHRGMASREMACKRMAMDSYSMRERGGGGYGMEDYRKRFDIYANYEYISESGLTISNLKPNLDGQIQIPISQLGNYSKFVVFASDTFGHVMAKHNLQPTSYDSADLRLNESKPAGIIYTEDRFCLPVSKGSNAVVKDLKNCQISFLETQKDILDALLVITGCDKNSLNEWKFLTNWGNLSSEEKLNKFDKYGGDELNVFTYIKDRDFFNQHILPILRFKSESRLIDYILTKNEDLIEPHFSLHGVSKLNPIELLLLLDHYKETKSQLCKQIVTGLEHKISARHKNDTQKNVWLDSIIASKKVESEEPIIKEPEELLLTECLNEIAPPSMLRCSNAPQTLSFAMARTQDLILLNEDEDERRSSLKKCEEKKSVSKRRSRKRTKNAFEGLDSGRIIAEKKPVQIKKYKKAGAAFEYGERHQFFTGSNSAGSINEFWISIMKSIVSGEGNQILNENFVYASDTNYNIIYALAFTNLPFNKGTIDSKTIDKDLQVSSSDNFLVLVKKMEEKTTDPLNLDLIISQKFYDPQEKFTYDETDSSIRTIKEVSEFLIGKIYESQITFTNISENQLKLKVIQQIPQGSLPVYNLDDLKIHDVMVSGLQTQKITFKFYFPSAGTFSCYPATITKNNRFIAHSNIPSQLKVVEEFIRDGKVLDSLQDILNYGSAEDILKFMSEKNLYNSNIFNINQVMWLLQDKNHYSQALQILKDKCFFNAVAWGYSLKHHDLDTFQEWAHNTSNLESQLSQLQYFKNKYVKIDRFKPLEYDPLINARAHSISDKKQNILNKDFRKTYEGFLEYCVERPSLSARELIILTSYFTLQDRIEEALVLVKKIDGEEVNSKQIMVVQYDYLRAYLSIFEEFPSFSTAREITNKYTNFADLSWRKMFLEIANQLAEYDGAQGTEIEDDENKAIKHASNKEQSEQAEYLKAENKSDSNDITLTYMNLESVTISYFKLNMEILFSKDPFLDKNINNFSFVNPNAQQTLALSPASDFANVSVTVPEELQSSSLFVHIQGKSRSTTLKIFNSNLKVHPIEDFGLLKIADKSGKILNSIYVKCYYKGKSGETKFYKDGYSDFRGSFDYASLNSNSLDKVDTFALLVTDEKYGSTILKVKPPKKVGTMA